MSGSNGSPAASFGLLVLRVTSGAMLVLAHGWPKLMGWAERSKTFADPLHIGHDRSLMLVIFAEVLCASLVAIGFATRFAAAVLVILFSVIVFSIHAGDPFSKKELPILYGVVYLALACIGPGGYALDARWGPKVKFGGGK
jgi:putative oxidoreductase